MEEAIKILVLFDIFSINICGRNCNSSLNYFQSRGCKIGLFVWCTWKLGKCHLLCDFEGVHTLSQNRNLLWMEQFFVWCFSV